MYFNSILKYIHYICCFINSPPSNLADCFLFDALDFYAPTLIPLLFFQLPKSKLPLKNQSSCTLSVFSDCQYHLHCIPLLIGSMYHQTCPHAWKGPRKDTDSRPVNTIHHPISCQCCLLNPCIAYLYLQMRAY